MSRYHVLDSKGQVIHEDDDRQAAFNLTKHFKTLNAVLDTETGERFDMPKGRPRVYTFARRQIVLKVHPDDRQTILGAAASMNQIRLDGGTPAATPPIPYQSHHYPFERRPVTVQVHDDDVDAIRRLAYQRNEYRLAGTVTVQVHPDDAQTIRDTARALNEARKL